MMSLISFSLVSKLLGRSQREDGRRMAEDFLSFVRKTWFYHFSFNFLGVTEQVTGGYFETNMIPIISLVS